MSVNPEWDEKVQAELDKLLAEYEDDPDEKILAAGQQIYSPREIVEGYRNGDIFLRRFGPILISEIENDANQQQTG